MQICKLQKIVFDKEEPVRGKEERIRKTKLRQNSAKIGSLMEEIFKKEGRHEQFVAGKQERMKKRSKSGRIYKKLLNIQRRK